MFSHAHRHVRWIFEKNSSTNKAFLNQFSHSNILTLWLLITFYFDIWIQLYAHSMPAHSHQNQSKNGPLIIIWLSHRFCWGRSKMDIFLTFIMELWMQALDFNVSQWNCCSWVSHWRPFSNESLPEFLSFSFPFPLPSTIQWETQEIKLWTNGNGKNWSKREESGVLGR